MIRLDVITKSLKLTAGDTCEVIVSGFNKTSTSVTEFSEETACTATTQQISAIPAASTYKNIDHISIKNTGASNTVQVQIFNSSGAVTTHSMYAVLAANETLEYTHAGGWQVLSADGSKRLSNPNYARLDIANSFTGIQSMTSPAITTSITTPSTTFALVNTTATTLNFAGAATTLNVGNAGGTNTILGASNFSQLLTANAGITVPTGQAVALNGTTTLSVGGAITSNLTSGYALSALSATTGSMAVRFGNTGGTAYFALDDSTGGFITGSAAYSTILDSGSTNPVHIGVNNIVVGTFSTTALTLAANINLTGSGTGAISGFNTLSVGAANTASLTAGFNGTNANGTYIEIRNSTVPKTYIGSAKAIGATGSPVASDTALYAAANLYLEANGGTTYLKSTAFNVSGSLTAGAISGTTGAFSGAVAVGTGHIAPVANTTGITTTATTIYTANGAANGIIVYISGNDGSNYFLDEIFTLSGGTINVNNSKTVFGSPSARTYSFSGANLQLAMTSGTYSTNVSVLELY